MWYVFVFWILAVKLRKLYCALEKKRWMTKNIHSKKTPKNTRIFRKEKKIMQIYLIWFEDNKRRFQLKITIQVSQKFINKYLDVIFTCQLRNCMRFIAINWLEILFSIQIHASNTLLTTYGWRIKAIGGIKNS